MELLSWNYFYENIKIFCNLVHLLKLNEINILKEKGKIYIHMYSPYNLHMKRHHNENRRPCRRRFCTEYVRQWTELLLRKKYIYIIKKREYSYYVNSKKKEKIQNKQF